MLFVSLFKWWYGAGWRDQLALTRARLLRTSDFFSIGLSARTLFKPFKQIDADRSAKGSLDIILRTMFDQLFSRIFGSVVRTLLIIVGVLALAVEFVIGGVRLTVWPFVLILPLITAPLALLGWVPWR